MSRPVAVMVRASFTTASDKASARTVRVNSPPPVAWGQAARSRRAE